MEKDQSANNKSKLQQTNFIGFKFPGVEIVPNFIAREEEAELVDKIDKNLWKNSQSGRKKQDYGPKVNFKKQKLKMSTFNGLPFYISEVVTKMKQLSFLKDFYIVEQCNLEYVPERGSQIEPHFDDSWLWGERLVTLNMLSDTWFTMNIDNDQFVQANFFTSFQQLDVNNLDEFKQPQALETCTVLQSSLVQVKIPLKRYSLVMLSGPARHRWKHAITRLVLPTGMIIYAFFLMMAELTQFYVLFSTLLVVLNIKQEIFENHF